MNTGKTLKNLSIMGKGHPRETTAYLVEIRLSLEHHCKTVVKNILTASTHRTNVLSALILYTDITLDFVIKLQTKTGMALAGVYDGVVHYSAGRTR